MSSKLYERNPAKSSTVAVARGTFSTVCITVRLCTRPRYSIDIWASKVGVPGEISAVKAWNVAIHSSVRGFGLARTRLSITS